MTLTYPWEHRPKYDYCSDPELCCYTYGPISIRCAADNEPWPCATKRSHHTAAYGEKLARWAESRVERSYVEEAAW